MFKLLNSLLNCMPYSFPNTDNLVHRQQKKNPLLSNNFQYVLGTINSEGYVSFSEMAIGVKFSKVFPKPVSFTDTFF